MNPSISIIVPVYNAEKYLGRCLDTILAQTFNDFEVILVNDGSRDKSPIICDDYARKDVRIRVLHKENRGVSAARQTGLDASRGNYIIHVDADDWVAPNYLKNLYEEAIKSNADITICDYVEVYPKKYVYKDQKPTSTSTNDFVVDLCTRLHGSCCNKLLKSSIIKQRNVTFPSGINLMEDKLFVFKYACNSQTITYLPQALYYYNRGSHSPSPPIIEKMKAAYLNLEEYISSLNIKNAKLYEAIDLYYLTISSAVVVYGDWQDSFLKPISTIRNIKNIGKLKQLSTFHKLALLSRILYFKPLHTLLITIHNQIKGSKTTNETVEFK